MKGLLYKIKYFECQCNDTAEKGTVISFPIFVIHSLSSAFSNSRNAKCTNVYSIHLYKRNHCPQYNTQYYSYQAENFF